MALLLSRKLDEITELHTSDGVIRIWYMRTIDGHVRLAIDAPHSVTIKRDNMNMKEGKHD